MLRSLPLGNVYDDGDDDDNDPEGIPETTKSEHGIGELFTIRIFPIAYPLNFLFSFTSLFLSLKVKRKS